MDEYKYGDWTYKLDHGNQYVDHPLGTPDSVFKYYSNSPFNRDAIKNQYLYCSHPYQLNDSMDCSNLLWDFKNLQEDKYNLFFKQYPCAEFAYKQYSKAKSENFSSIKDLYFQKLSNRIGIISLTSLPIHTLMWAHYATEKGFMIELDWEILKTNLNRRNTNLNNYVFFPVQYVRSLQSIDCFSNGYKSFDIPLLYSASIKRDDWNYENEWRLITYIDDLGIPFSSIMPFDDYKGKAERKIYYPLEAIKSVILGKHFFNGETLEEIKSGNEYILKNGDNLDFIHFIIENFNDKLYLCGEYEDANFKRSAEKIKLYKKDQNVIHLERFHEGFFDNR